MEAAEISVPAWDGDSSDAPVELAIARQQLMKLGMYARYSPQSARYLRDCIAYELERAEKILRDRLACPAVDKHRNDLREARRTLDMLWN